VPFERFVDDVIAPSRDGPLTEDEFAARSIEPRQSKITYRTRATNGRSEVPMALP
jgi:hypothetical protein